MNYMRTVFEEKVFFSLIYDDKPSMDTLKLHVPYCAVPSLFFFNENSYILNEIKFLFIMKLMYLK